MRLLFGVRRRSCRCALRLYCSAFGELFLLAPLRLGPLLFLTLSTMTCTAPRRDTARSQIPRQVQHAFLFHERGTHTYPVEREKQFDIRFAGPPMKVFSERLAGLLSSCPSERSRFLSLSCVLPDTPKAVQGNRVRVAEIGVRILFGAKDMPVPHGAVNDGRLLAATNRVP